MGNPLDFLMGGQNGAQSQYPVSVAPWATKGQGQEQDIIAQLLAKEEERQRKEKTKALALLGVGLTIGKAMNNGQGTMDNGKPGAKSSPAASRGNTGGNGGSGLVSAVSAKSSPGGSRRDSGAAASKPEMVNSTSVDGAKFFPMDLMSGAGGAAAAGGFMSNPLAGAAVAGGIDLVGGLIGGDGGQEEMAKRQLRQQGQQNLGQGIRSMAEMLRSRNMEMRNVLANLGR